MAHPFSNQLATLVGQVGNMPVENSTLLQQMDHAGLKPAGATLQSNMLTLVLLPCPVADINNKTDKCLLLTTLINAVTLPTYLPPLCYSTQWQLTNPTSKQKIVIITLY